MRFDGKSTGLFSDEEPKRKKKIKITEDQYNRLFNLNEEDEASTDSGSSSGGGSQWSSGASSYTNLTRGKANPIGNTQWSSGASSYKNITRGPANPL